MTASRTDGKRRRIEHLALGADPDAPDGAERAVADDQEVRAVEDDGCAHARCKGQEAGFEKRAVGTVAGAEDAVELEALVPFGPHDEVIRSVEGRRRVGTRP